MNNISKEEKERLKEVERVLKNYKIPSDTYLICEGAANGKLCLNKDDDSKWIISDVDKMFNHHIRSKWGIEDKVFSNLEEAIIEFIRKIALTHDDAINMLDSLSFENKCVLTEEEKVLLEKFKHILIASGMNRWSLVRDTHICENRFDHIKEDYSGMCNTYFVKENEGWVEHYIDDYGNLECIYKYRTLKDVINALVYLYSRTDEIYEMFVQNGFGLTDEEIEFIEESFDISSNNYLKQI